MKVEQYGLMYYRVKSEDLELVRYWRNRESIRSTMQFNEYITPQMQLKWFEGINNPENYYFIIVANKKKIGLISCKNTAENTRIAEGGIFIWDQKFWGTPVPVFASMTMLEAVFEIFKSGDASIATVRKDNQRALTFNQLLGYKIIGETENRLCWKLMLTKEDYSRINFKIRRAGNLYSNGKVKLVLTGKPDSTQDKIINDYLMV